MEAKESKLIYSYHYCNGNTDYYYRLRVPRTSEQEKINSLEQKIISFSKKEDETYSKKDLRYDLGIIDYLNGEYFTYINSDRDIVDVYSLGKTEDEAFYASIIKKARQNSLTIECRTRKLQEEIFNQTFENKEYSTGLMCYILAYKEIKEYFNNNIPIELQEYYERRITSLTNSLKEKNKPKVYVKKEGK